MKDLKEKNLEELTTLLAEKREEMRKIRFGTAGSGMRDTRALRTLRRDIARICTELNVRRTVVTNQA